MKAIRLLLSMFLLALVGTMSGQTITINKLGGEKVEFSFSERPVMTFSATSLIITTAERRVEVALAELSDMSSKGLPTLLERISVDDEGIGGSDQKGITISGEKSGAEVGIYTLSGVKVATVAVDADGKAVIPWSALSGGTYIVKTSTTTYKIMKR